MYMYGVTTCFCLAILRASPTGRRILDIIYVRLRRVRTQKVVTCSHVSASSPAAEAHFLTARTCHALIRQEREKNFIYVVKSDHGHILD
jgi:hypothetical protein